MPIVAHSRPLPGDFRLPDVADVDLRVGPEQGFASVEAGYDFFRGAHACVTWVTDRIDDAFLDAVGDQLEVVSNFAVGFDNIDVAACTRRDVIVTNTPDAVTEATADVAVMLLLGAARRASAADRFVRSGDWAKHGVLAPTEFLGLPVAGKTLLIVGAGRIGYATAIRMLGWGMRTLYVARSPKPSFEAAPLNAERIDLDEGLARADFISIHTPLTEDTRHLIDARRLSLCKPTAVLVNTARGPVIDEAALADALHDRRIAAAGLDVFEREPEVHPKLLTCENTLFTPHFGSADSRSRAAMTDLCADNINAILSGKPPVTPVSV
jgi:glyoxylate reductase